MVAVDANIGNTVWQAKSPNRYKCSYCGFGATPPIVDKETDRLYICDRREVFCLELPK
jgi:hypothetical protein